MGDVAWPRIPFYIAQRFSVPEGYPPNTITAVGVTRTQDQGYLIGYPAPISGDPSQLWITVPDPLGTGTSIQNLLTGQILVGSPCPTPSYAPWQHDYVTAAPASSGSPNRFWALDDHPGDGQVRIYCVPSSLNWFMQCNPSYPGGRPLPWPTFLLAGWGDVPDSASNVKDGSTAAATFKIFPETGKVTISNVRYQIASAITDLTLPPVAFLAVDVDNTTGTDLTANITLSGSATETKTFDMSHSDTTATTLTTTMPLELSLINIFLKATETGGVDQYSSKVDTWGSGEVDSHTWDNKIATTVTVPARKKYSYQQQVNYGQIRVPYTATGTLNSGVPGTPPFTFSLGGFFVGVGAVNSTIIVRDAAPASAPTGTAPGAEQTVRRPGTEQVVHQVQVPLFPKTPVSVPAPKR